MIEFSTDTNGQDFNKFSLQLGQTKSASLVSIPEDLNDRAFANPHSRELPTHTKEATLQSTIYFYGNKLNGNTWSSNFPEEMVEARLEKSAKFWNVVSDFNEIKDYTPTIEKKASIKISYALDDQNLLPTHNEESLIKSASSLLEDPSDLSFYDRSKAASKILTQNYTLGTDKDILSQDTRADLEKIAGLNPKKASEAKKKIIVLAHDQSESLKDSLLKLASTITDDSLYTELCLALDDTITKKSFIVEDIFFNRGLIEEPMFTLTNGQSIKVASIKAAGTDPFSVLGEGVPYKVSDGHGLDYKKAQIFLSNMSRPDSDLYYKAINSFLR